MKNTLQYIILFYFIVSGCSSDEGFKFPDFDQCNCPSFHRDIVCGDDGRTYLDSCHALCLNINIVQPGSCPGASTESRDTLNWPIETICIPIVKDSDPMEIRTLGDGSILYQNADGSFFRGTPNLCRCLPPSTLIATPSGGSPLFLLRPGDDIWTLDTEGRKITRSVAYVGNSKVPDDHQMLHFKLEDGRQLKVSPFHPDVHGVPLNQTRKGDCLDGSLVIECQLIEYEGTRTWDLLPEGETGLYFANGILIKSTFSSLVQ